MNVIMGLAAVLLLVFTASRLRPTFVEWCLYIFLLGLAIMPSRIRIMAVTPDSTITAMDILVWSFLLLVLLIRALQPKPPKVDEIVIGLPLGVFCIWAYITGAISGYPDWFSAVSEALLHWVPSFIACWIGVSILPRTASAFQRFETYYKALAAFAIAPQIFLTAFNLGGWEVDASMDAAGFLRGWSCIGTGIVTAACILPAYLLALRDFFTMRGNQNWAIALAAAIFLAILFTLARSVMALLIIGSISLMVHYSRRSLAQLAVLAGIAVTLGVVMWITMSQLSFTRLTKTRGDSTDLRIESLLGAFESGMEQPIWGHGFGCLYNEIRAEGSIRGERETIDVAGHESALEPHNAYALCWSETGIIGLAIFLALLLSFRRHSPFFHWDKSVDDYTERTIWWVVALFFLSGSNLLLYHIPAVFLTLPFMFVFFSTSNVVTRHGKRHDEPN
jgi:hypothetical protein